MTDHPQALPRSLGATPVNPNEQGFSLVELLIALSVFLVVITIALGELSSGISKTQALDTSANSASTNRLAVNEIVRELRQAATGDASIPTFAVVSPTALTFYSPDLLTPKHMRRIGYRLTSGVIERTQQTSTNSGNPPWVFPATAPVWTPVVSSVNNTDIFTFVDVAGIATTTSAKVSRLTLRIETKSGLSAAGFATYRVDVDVRTQR